MYPTTNSLLRIEYPMCYYVFTTDNIVHLGLNPSSATISCVTLAKLLNISAPQVLLIILVCTS